MAASAGGATGFGSWPQLIDTITLGKARSLDGAQQSWKAFRRTLVHVNMFLMRACERPLGRQDLEVMVAYLACAGHRSSSASCSGWCVRGQTSLRSNTSDKGNDSSRSEWLRCTRQSCNMY